MSARGEEQGTLLAQADASRARSKIAEVRMEDPFRTRSDESVCRGGGSSPPPFQTDSHLSPTPSPVVSPLYLSSLIHLRSLCILPVQGVTGADGYADARDRDNTLSPELVGPSDRAKRVSGGLRQTDERMSRSTDLFSFSPRKDPSGFKYRRPFQRAG